MLFITLENACYNIKGNQLISYQIAYIIILNMLQKSKETRGNRNDIKICIVDPLGGGVISDYCFLEFINFPLDMLWVF